MTVNMSHYFIKDYWQTMYAPNPHTSPVLRKVPDYPSMAFQTGLVYHIAPTLKSRYLNAVRPQGTVTHEEIFQLSFAFANYWQPHKPKPVKLQGVLAMDDTTRDWMELALTEPVFPEECSHDRQVTMPYKVKENEPPYHMKTPLPTWQIKPPLPGDTWEVPLEHPSRLDVKLTFLCREDHAIEANDAFTRQYMAHLLRTT